MSTVLILAVVALAIAAIIRALHRYQIRKRLQNADRSAPLELPLPSAEPSDHPEPPEPGEPRHWQRRLKELRDAGDFDAALALSRAQYPRIQAFQQSLVTLRAALRQAQREKGEIDALLEALHFTAALADLFRPGAPLRPDPRRVDSAGLAAAAAERLALPYARVGYERLRLLTRTDVRLLVTAWGEPEAHRHAEEVAAEAWPALIEALSTGIGPEPDR